eukprot:m.187313 g.187313  ORF g.187313 m.187313 type:complete len:95 (-) comp18505_c1_seq2:239-523(-)
MGGVVMSVVVTCIRTAATVLLNAAQCAQQVSKAFKLFDEDGTGMISVANLRRVARELGENMTDDELQAMISEFDSSNKGALTESDFLSIMTADF